MKYNIVYNLFHASNHVDIAGASSNASITINQSPVDVYSQPWVKEYVTGNLAGYVDGFNALRSEFEGVSNQVTRTYDYATRQLAEDHVATSNRAFAALAAVSNHAFSLDLASISNQVFRLDLEGLSNQTFATLPGDIAAASNQAFWTLPNTIGAVSALAVVARNDVEVLVRGVQELDAELSQTRATLSSALLEITQTRAALSDAVSQITSLGERVAAMGG